MKNVCVGTIAFIHGPQGSGKSRMLQIILRESGWYVLPSLLTSYHSLTFEHAQENNGHRL
jgi:pantothenate kinase-related protein Tda10